MKVFERDASVNFVDENNVVLGYSMDQCCCENADWFIADTPQEDLGPRGELPDLEGFVFDTEFFKEVNGGHFDDGGMAIFRIVKGSAEKFIHIFNCQNGYYSHGFNFAIEGGKVIRAGTL
jgi:hypothetical protein